MSLFSEADTERLELGQVLCDLSIHDQYLDLVKCKVAFFWSCVPDCCHYMTLPDFAHLVMFADSVLFDISLM